MRSVVDQLTRYAKRAAADGLTAGTGGNVSARDGELVWMKPSGLAMDELGPDEWCGLDFATGRQVRGARAPTSEYRMHLAVYHARSDVRAVFHMHPPWLTGVITSDAGLLPLVSEVVFYLGRLVTLPYIVPTSAALAEAVARAAPNHDTIMMPHHGMLAMGTDVRQAYHRCVVAEHAAIAQVAAAAAGRPRLLTDEQVSDLRTRMEKQL